MRNLVRVLLFVSLSALTMVTTAALADPGPDPCERDRRYCR